MIGISIMEGTTSGWGLILWNRCAYNFPNFKMGVKMRGKIHTKNHGGRTSIIKIYPKFRRRRLGKIKIRYLVVAVVLAGAILVPHLQTDAKGCPDLRIVFARGSGGERWSDQNYLAFKNTIAEKLARVSLNYEFIDLDYPAVGIGIDKLGVTAGAFFGSGDAYEFGESVNTGVRNLAEMVNGTSCPSTRYVVGGYSQGAMVISKSLGSLNADRLIYAATFGDPKIYLPEGAGLMPAACRGENLSDYRMYVPDCQAYKGLLGAHIPYEPVVLAGKVGTWCNNRDILCSSRHLDLGGIADHISYVTDNLYEDAAKVIFDKVAKAFGLENHISSPHDTAILIDSTGSMASMIEQYKAEALRLATETLESGGRVALFDYRDLNDPYDLVQHCDFENCTLEVFRNELEGIQANGGGDAPESLLSASFHTMESLHWKQGSTKSLVILTDANFLMPDRDGMTFDEVVALSKRIDPVNFYIITDAQYGEDYAALAEATDGRVVTNFDELSLLTDYIMERYDSLPRVEEMEAPVELPKIEVVSVIQESDGVVKIGFTNSGERAIVVLNDKILGMAEGSEVIISGLDASISNIVTLVPLGEDVRGEGVEVKLRVGGKGGVATSVEAEAVRAPNAGGR